LIGHAGEAETLQTGPRTDKQTISVATMAKRAIIWGRFMKSGENDLALRTCALSMNGLRPTPETKSRLRALAGGDARADAAVARYKEELERLRTVDSIARPDRYPPWALCSGRPGWMPGQNRRSGCQPNGPVDFPRSSGLASTAKISMLKWFPVRSQRII